MGFAPKMVQHGKPTHYTWFEHFNRTDRTEDVDHQVFESLQNARALIADGLHRYHHNPRNESLGCMPPVEYRTKQLPNCCFCMAQEIEVVSDVLLHAWSSLEATTCILTSVLIVYWRQHQVRI